METATFVHETMTLGPVRHETINGRVLTVQDRDMTDLPNLAAQGIKLAIATGPRGAQGWLYTRRNGTRWILWIPQGRMGKPRTEEVR